MKIAVSVAKSVEDYCHSNYTVVSALGIIKTLNMLFPEQKEWPEHSMGSHNLLAMVGISCQNESRVGNFRNNKFKTLLHKVLKVGPFFPPIFAGGR